jgi:hypothetical protein
MSAIGVGSPTRCYGRANGEFFAGRKSNALPVCPRRTIPQIWPSALLEKSTAGDVLTFVEARTARFRNLIGGSRSAQGNSRSDRLDVVVQSLFRHPKI